MTPQLRYRMMLLHALRADDVRIEDARQRALARLWEPCGAMTRKGTPCRCKPIPGKKRCKYHGGMSTGPRTPEGKARALSAMQEGRRRWREARKKSP